MKKIHYLKDAESGCTACGREITGLKWTTNMKEVECTACIKTVTGDASGFGPGLKLNCEDCIYFKPGHTNLGSCLRYPPQTISLSQQGSARYPLVDSVETICGEFKHSG